MKRNLLIIIAIVQMTLCHGENFWEKLDRKIYEYAMKGRDTSYVVLPKQKFLATVNYTNTFSQYKMYIPYYSDKIDASIGQIFLEAYGKKLEDYFWYDIDLDSRESKAAIGLCYYNISLKYAIPLQNHNTNQFTFNYNGSRYGLNLNYRYSKALSGTVCGGYDVMIEQAMKYIETGYLPSYEEACRNVTTGISAECNTLKTLNVGFYYQFNGSKYNVGSALNSKFIQKRSAGGFFLKGNYYQSSYFCYNNDDNNGGTMVLGDWEKYNVYQLSFGGGYGYNWTPNQGKFLLHASVSPMVSVFNKATHETGWEESEYKESDFTDYFQYMRNNPRMAVNTQFRIAGNYNFSNYVVGAIVNGNFVNYYTQKHFKLRTPVIDCSVYLGVRF